MKAITESGKKILLNDAAEIHRGGEGRILLVKELPGQVAKIYFDRQKALSPARAAALRQLSDPCFVKPGELLLEPKSGEVLGFLMDYLGKDFFQLSALFSQQFCQRNGIDEARKLAIAKKMAAGIVHAHSRQLVIGDLSGLNMLINPQDELRFIDVDAYGSPVQPHSGVLLDEIRDYLYQGDVSVQSDYFAFAVLIFNLFCFTHPFKGVHRRFKSLQERMIHKLPVFAADSELIVPKCYQPVSSPLLQQQFEDIFMKGSRFMLSLDAQPAAAQPVKTKAAAPPLPKAALQLRPVYTPLPAEVLTDAFALHSRLLLKTNQRYLLYDCANYGYTQLQQELPVSVADALFIGDKQLLARKGLQLLVWDKDRGFVPLQNFSFTPESRCVQLQNLLAVIEDDYLRLLYLDEINKNFIRVEQTQAFGKGMYIAGNSIYQIAGGRQYLFYHSGKTLSTVQLPVPLHQVHLQGNCGLLSYRDYQPGVDTSLKQAWFSIHNMQVSLSTIPAQAVKAFACKTQQGLIFEPADDKLIVRRRQDFALLQEIECRLLSEQTQLFYTQAGIVAVESGFCQLLNS